MPRLFAKQMANGPHFKSFWGQVEDLQRAKGRQPFSTSLSASWNVLPLLDLFQARNMQVFILESALVTLKEATAF